jgi:hypothetical protein
MQADEMMDFDKFKEIMSRKFYTVFLEEESPNMSLIGPNVSQVRRKLTIRQRLSYKQMIEDATKSER